MDQMQTENNARSSFINTGQNEVMSNANPQADKGFSFMDSMDFQRDSLINNTGQESLNIFKS